MPMYELSESEIKVIEERRRIATEQSGFRQGVRAVINMLSNRTPTSKEEHQLLMDLARDAKRIEFPITMRLEAGFDGARVGA